MVKVNYRTQADKCIKKQVQYLEHVDYAKDKGHKDIIDDLKAKADANRDEANRYLILLEKERLAKQQKKVAIGE